MLTTAPTTASGSQSGENTHTHGQSTTPASRNATKAPDGLPDGDGICDDTLISLWADAERLAGARAEA